MGHKDLKYRKWSNKCPGHLLIFDIFGGALIGEGHLFQKSYFTEGRLLDHLWYYSTTVW